MTKERLTAFSDGVIAVIITIMVLEMKVPHGTGLAALWPLAPVFGSYVLSFVYVGIYWNNHHHLLYAARSIDGRILWANLHLLFWLSLIPFCSGWMGKNHFETRAAAGSERVRCCATLWPSLWPSSAHQPRSPSMCSLRRSGSYQIVG